MEAPMLHTAHTASTNAFIVGETIKRAACSWVPAASAAYWPPGTTEREEGDTWYSEEEASCGQTDSLQKSNHSYIYNQELTAWVLKNSIWEDCKGSCLWEEAATFTLSVLVVFYSPQFYFSLMYLFMYVSSGEWQSFTQIRFA